MSENFISTLNIEPYKFDGIGLRKMEQNPFVKETWPVTYIISDNGIGEAYVGESTNVLNRMRSHIKNPDRNKLGNLYLITSNKFNKSSTLDIESNLIKYLAADGKFKLQNGNAGLINHTYYQREQYSTLFQAIWKGLIDKGIAINQLSEIDNSDLFKYSPYKSLTLDQHEAIVRIIQVLQDESKETIIVEGGAGTGKTILAVYLMKLLKSKEHYDLELTDDELGELAVLKQLDQQKPDLKIGLVIPMTSLRKTLKKVFKHVKGLSASMVIGPAQVVKQKYDLLIVDEAHRLHRRVGITNYGSYDKACEKLGMDKMTTTELDWILHQSEHQILFYDELQSIRPSDIPRKDFNKLINSSSSQNIKLTSQLRVKGGLDYIKFVEDLLDVKESKTDLSQIMDYEVKLFHSLKTMHSELQLREEKYGLCRLVAGYAWPWQSKGGKDLPDIEIDGLKFKWNTTNEDWINSGNASNEVGCIHTTQGYDLNYVGVIFGSEIGFDLTRNEIVIYKDKYYDTKGKVSTKDPEVLKNYVINIYKTLMLRGIMGCYVYVCDRNLRKYIEKNFEQFN